MVSYEEPHRGHDFEYNLICVLILFAAMVMSIFDIGSSSKDFGLQLEPAPSGE
jgi:hypothetical protein